MCYLKYFRGIKMEEKQIRPFGMRDKIGYALGDFGCNMSFAFINNYLMLFYVTCMKIKPHHFAIIILLAKYLMQ